MDEVDLFDAPSPDAWWVREDAENAQTILKLARNLSEVCRSVEGLLQPINRRELFDSFSPLCAKELISGIRYHLHIIHFWYDQYSTYEYFESAHKYIKDLDDVIRLWPIMRWKDAVWDGLDKLQQHDRILTVSVPMLEALVKSFFWAAQREYHIDLRTSDQLPSFISKDIFGYWRYNEVSDWLGEPSRVGLSCCIGVSRNIDTYELLIGASAAIYEIPAIRQEFYKHRETRIQCPAFDKWKEAEAPILDKYGTLWKWFNKVTQGAVEKGNAIRLALKGFPEDLQRWENLPFFVFPSTHQPGFARLIQACWTCYGAFKYAREKKPFEKSKVNRPPNCAEWSIEGQRYAKACGATIGRQKNDSIWTELKLWILGPLMYEM